MKGTDSIDTERPSEEVFAFLDDEENLPKVVPNLVDHGISDETPEKVGTTFWRHPAVDVGGRIDGWPGYAMARDE